MKSKILIWGELPPKTSTGVSISNRMICQYIQKRGQALIIIEEHSWGKNSILKLFHVLHLYLRLFNKLCRHRPHIFYFSFPASIIGGLKIIIPLFLVRLISRRTRIIGHIHRGDFKEFIYRNRKNRMMVDRIVSLVHDLIVLSQKYQDELRNIYQNTSIWVLHNTSSIQLFPKKLDMGYSGRFICVSNYIKSKGIQDLFDCFCLDSIKELHLSIYGHPYDRPLFRKLQMSSPANIEINGALSRDEISKTIINFDCLVIPSWNEGQPIIILEAMSLGIPIISTDVGDIPNMLGKEYPFIIKPKDVNSIRAAIISFNGFNNKDELGEQLNKRYHSHYSNDLYENKLKEIFKF